MLPQFVIRRTVAIAIVIAATTSGFGDDPTDFFEKQIRPILVQHCSGCHGAKKQSGSLRIDSLDALLAGGDRGAAIVPAHPEESLLVQAVTRGGDLEMPPDKPLTEPQIAALRHWIAEGAVWPSSAGQLRSLDDESATNHWAFQNITRPEVPDATDVEPLKDWAITPVDAFVLRRLQLSGLSPSPRADRRTLLRRVSYALTGLPPTPAMVSEFEDDRSPDAWERVIDRLLNSKHYGQQWARHWLDVARYSDTKGYVYAREERFWVHAWAYRDWVIDALNSDMPYDRFLLLQLAADQVDDRDDNDLTAMGFLTLGRRFLGIRDDIIDDRIDVVCRGTMGLTVSCARCHDHKFDPIPTADYYSLYGVFDSCAEQLVRVGSTTEMAEAFQVELAKRTETLITERRKQCDIASEAIRDRVAEYLMAQTELHKYPPAGFDQIIVAEDLHPRIVSRWQTWLYDAERREDPVFRAWHEYASLPKDDFATTAVDVTKKLSALPAEQINPLVAALFDTTPQSFDEVVQRYGKLLSDVNADWKSLLKSAAEAGKNQPDGLPDADREQLRRILYGADSPCVIPDEHIANTEPLFPSAVVNELWKHQNALDRWMIDSETDLACAMTLVDRDVPSEPRIFVRGDATNLGAPVNRKFLSFLSEDGKTAFRTGSGRRELADAIIDPQNPLTARVIVNRVWMHLFGQGLVRTPSDFGLRAGRPSHPKLLDWLASWFMDNGWSLKKLHRLILSSAVYQQAAVGGNPADVQNAWRIDPDNRLLWRSRPHRLTFEELRDSLLQASGGFDARMGGKPFDLFTTQDARRTIYALIDRQYLPSALRTFDFASPELHVPRRSETSVPQQALFTMNHDMVLRHARLLAESVQGVADPKLRVGRMFQQTLQRDPTSSELEDALTLVSDAENHSIDAPPKTAADWSYGYGMVDETTDQVADFKPAPHFTGTSWQGGTNWPDAALGWVSLTAVGGHPGNTRNHACVRRWTAPEKMTIRIESKLAHEPAAGDGIRAFVLASSRTKLHAVKIHQKTIDLNVDSITVSKGDFVDFVVDIDEVLNSDQFLWEITITQQDQSPSLARWNSKADFPNQTIRRLTPWEQLAQVLLCTNEFMFVD
ncbi:MAG: PSD1 domain-containing protein [Planctomycetales bacterium]|nr:PSD1 domain-containing protein [Planctomycetales bacterium]